MDFDDLLRNFDSSAGYKEQVALAMYYFEIVRGEDYVHISDIKNVVNHSRSPLNPDHVYTYMDRLDKIGWVTNAFEDSYQLTHSGIDGVKELLDETALNEARDPDDTFIDIQIGISERHQHLIEDINLSYRHRIYDGTLVLTRKLFEDIIFNTLKNHYGGEDVLKYYDQENGEHYSFDELLSIYKDNVPELRQYSRDLEQSMLEDIRELKNAGNLGAHSIRVEFTDDEMDDWSLEATRLAGIFYEIYQDTQ